jgi:hypothetical protein
MKPTGNADRDGTPWIFFRVTTERQTVPVIVDNKRGRDHRHDGQTRSPLASLRGARIAPLSSTGFDIGTLGSRRYCGVRASCDGFGGRRGMIIDSPDPAIGIERTHWSATSRSIGRMRSPNDLPIAKSHCSIAWA